MLSHIYVFGFCRG